MGIEYFAESGLWLSIFADTYNGGPGIVKCQSTGASAHSWSWAASYVTLRSGVVGFSGKPVVMRQFLQRRQVDWKRFDYLFLLQLCFWLMQVDWQFLQMSDALYFFNFCFERWYVLDNCVLWWGRTPLSFVNKEKSRKKVNKWQTSNCYIFGYTVFWV